MKHLYVVVHPEATHHITKVVGGWYDTTLTEKGLNQADRIGYHLRSIIPPNARVHIHSSDLQRCAVAAKHIAQSLGGIPVNETTDLRELAYGEAEGKPEAWLEGRYRFPPASPAVPSLRDEEAMRVRLDHDFGIKGAETRRQCGERVYRAMERDVFPLFGDGTGDVYQVVVTHGFAMVMVVAAWIGMPLDAADAISIASRKGSITVLQEDDVYHNRCIVSVNEMGHLTDV
ncbi:putative phosphoglycerate mutase [Fimicolochytrium jonesii]|uniref:putative phosphoglycerate mutase n=1 Tax=Fimicolochytrium jonesii TaxID=1396493 RepID=UPI0022FE7F39|nr:putative phosphoglycerate mutase [Fimicolochytrium jonesii]KAI8819142.1 putative phosphoglycerate mutase [Fimicolochytrium jonesii]